MNEQTPAREPQTAAYQAAVDNVATEITRSMNQERASRWMKANKMRWERVDYIIDLEEQIMRALGIRELGYELDC